MNELRISGGDYLLNQSDRDIPDPDASLRTIEPLRRALPAADRRSGSVASPTGDLFIDALFDGFPGKQFLSARFDPIDASLDFSGSRRFDLLLRLAIEAREQLGREVSALGDVELQRFFKKILGDLRHGGHPARGHAAQESLEGTGEDAVTRTGSAAAQAAQPRFVLLAEGRRIGGQPTRRFHPVGVSVVQASR